MSEKGKSEKDLEMRRRQQEIVTEGARKRALVALEVKDMQKKKEKDAKDQQFLQYSSQSGIFGGSGISSFPGMDYMVNGMHGQFNVNVSIIIALVLLFVFHFPNF